MKEKFYIWLSWNLPRDLVKWCAIRFMAHATCIPENSHKTPSGLSIIDCLSCWDSKTIK